LQLQKCNIASVDFVPVTFDEAAADVLRDRLRHDVGARPATKDVDRRQSPSARHFCNELHVSTALFALSGRWFVLLIFTHSEAIIHLMREYGCRKWNLATTKWERPMPTEDCPFKVVKTNGSDEVLARAVNLIIGKAAFETAKRMYPRDVLEYRNGAQVIERSGGE
jgi:hypothetical protein